MHSWLKQRALINLIEMKMCLGKVVGSRRGSILVAAAVPPCLFRRSCQFFKAKLMPSLKDFNLSQGLGDPAVRESPCQVL